MIILWVFGDQAEGGEEFGEGVLELAIACKEVSFFPEAFCFFEQAEGGWIFLTFNGFFVFCAGKRGRRERVEEEREQERRSQRAEEAQGAGREKQEQGREKKRLHGSRSKGRVIWEGYV